MTEAEPKEEQEEVPVKEEEEEEEAEAAGDQGEEEGGGGDGDNKAETTIVTQRTGAHTKDDCSDLTDNNNETDEQAPRSFPQKLMDILSHEDNAHIISWLPHGNGFAIHKKKTFANEVLPKYFKASKFTSFTRKLNRWGFSRVPRGPETGSYYHKLFRRDKAELCLQMTSNSGNKNNTQVHMAQHIMPSIPGMAGVGGMPVVGAAMFPAYGIPQAATTMQMAPQMMGNITPQQQQQQQMMWQQQMQQMMQFQQQMMQMQQQQTAGAASMPQQQQGAAGTQQQQMQPMQMMPGMNMGMNMMPGMQQMVPQLQPNQQQTTPQQDNKTELGSPTDGGEGGGGGTSAPSNQATPTPIANETVV